MNELLLTVCDLAIGYPHGAQQIRPVLNGVHLQIRRGDRIGIVGESGCGKSTLAQALLGFVRDNGVRMRGSVNYGSEELFGLAPDRLQAIRGADIAFVPQNAGQSLAPHRTVSDQIAEVLTIHRGMTGHVAVQRINALLTQMRFANPTQIASRYPHQLSGGQQQRIALAIALAGEPKLLVLDEPTTGLDVTTQAQLLALIHELSRDTQLATVLVSHDLAVIAQSCQRVLVMYAGSVVEDGEVSHIFRQPSHPYTRGLLAAIPDITQARLPMPLPGQLRHMVDSTQCVFLDRCQFAQPDCAVAPPLIQLTPQQAVRCHHWQTVTQQVDRKYDATLLPPVATASVQAPVLQLTALSATYARPTWQWWRPSTTIPVVQQVDLHVQAGQTCALVGESGSGKSTVARVIAGLHPPLHGDITIDGMRLHADVAQRSAPQRQQVQLIFQNPDGSLNPRHTVAEILYRPQAVFFGRTRAQALPHSRDMLQKMRLDDQYLERLPRQLSGGEKQRVAIARAFLADPTVIVCDEIVSALDVSVQAAVLQVLVDMQRIHGTALLFISHDLAVVRAIAQTVAVLFAGQICEHGPAESVMTTPHHPYTIMLLSAVLSVAKPMHSMAASTADPVQAVPAGGCPFRHRCAIAIAQRCADQIPPVQQLANGHQVRCHHPPAVLHAYRQDILHLDM